MDYALIVKPVVQRQMCRLDPPVLNRILQKLQQLQKNLKPPGVRKLRSIAHGYRVKVGDWRILYTIDDRAKEIQIYRIKHRAKAY